ncbi:MAG: hypothetical protein KAQ81_07520 [Deltaproteobacteria bacterium]|nr:hypothetical protein [Deltaproteobacteria bacterium]
MFDEEKKEEMPVEEEELEEPIEEPIEDEPEPATEAPHEKEELGPIEEIIPEIPEKKKPWWKFW